MKKKELKQSIDYVDEFRKMNALEKLPIINDKFQNMFEEDSTSQANNFMRIRNEPNIQKWDNSQDHQALLLNNQHIQQKTINHFKEQKQSYSNENTRVRDHFNMFKQWSEENKNTRNKKERFKFFYKEASPPKKISTEKKQKKQIPSSLLQNMNIGGNQASTLQILNAVVSGKQFKYDFKQINQKRQDQILQMPENKKNNQEKQESLLIQAFKKFSTYKNLQEINNMDENKISEQEFMYDLANIDEDHPKLEDYLLNKFIYKSVTKYYKNTGKDVEYFRDIGLPSRDLEKFTEMFTMGKDSLQDQTKQQSHYLHLLRESELNINKSDINFDDISNLSNGRVTSLNAYMCIRSEKVTKAQYEKLIKKLDKYKKQQMQKGKQKVEIGICTEDMDMQDQSGKQQILNEQKNQIPNLIQQISDIRQSVNLIKQKKQTKKISINQLNFKKQKYVRMQVLLKMLYEKIVSDPIKYPFSLLEDNIHYFDQMLQDQHKDGKLLWFILDCFEEISSDQQEEDNIKNILKKKPIEQPKLTFYKGKKVMKEEKLKVTNLYTYKEKATEKLIPTNDRSNVKIRKSVTPPKQLTPRKTATKKPIYKEASFTKNK